MINPFRDKDTDRAQIWEMLVSRDIKAYCEANWQMVADDFIEEGFMGIDGKKTDDPDQWSISFPNLKSYQSEWLHQAQLTKSQSWKGSLEEALHDLTTLTHIEIMGTSALAHKKFKGFIEKSDGDREQLQWQTLYRCRKIGGRWKIAGFVGYLPYPLGSQMGSRSLKSVPKDASQHVTAGPYSPVLEVGPGRIVVISGQAALNQAGEVMGDNIEDQTRVTLENCQQQLATAGCSFSDVFKVNVFLTDLDLWPRFNEVYKTYFPDPKPVRTAVQTPLLMTFLVEIELWAIKPANH